MKKFDIKTPHRYNQFAAIIQQQKREPYRPLRILYNQATGMLVYNIQTGNLVAGRRL
jgi:hypothetical protein